MLSYLANYAHLWGPLRLFGSHLFRAVMATGTALVIGFLVGPWLIGRFRALKFGHGYIDERTGALGATYFDKKHTPTMGGLIIFIAVFASSALWAEPNVWTVVALFVYTALTVPGWRDDYLKVVHKNKDGIRSWEKIAWQSLATLVALGVLLWHPQSSAKIRELWVPFLKTALIPYMPWWLLLVLIYLWIVGFSNAINLTDGLDGLAVGCTITVALVFGIMAYVADNSIAAQYLLISYVPGTSELTVICGALIGACMAFLWFNSHPAEVFMGDTGSLALGGLIGVMAFMIHQPLTLVIVGGVFVLEALSVILQVGWFKWTKRRTGTGRRLFLMAPIHHHFQKRGWPETKVVLRFWVLSLGFALAGLATLKLR
ncbi:phospho-N-acetylmuramoyl-pentapeptide-transferase [Opitutus sp. GAS368]|jgi:phospho-N-acetylmuramoyl-pentapeptide-transferase|uniref:phospho-N-acetylmuramoyl-pentapeptide- transferase n=1 Tax=Opitutus sp. GAS368 TaxID=1882749 RepID=UPI00087B62BB|nr:phospho-N-acetylmuramoyl-pentapeptide-transferase [Opitutus sp. GAS368]SDR67095.1 Phospho-N-acetylmuramoyl-pentapeptide-transferase [Opitutus sp. GAS368]